MVIEFFIDCFFGIADGFFAMLPEITWSLDTTPWEYVTDVLSMVSYLLPWDTVISIASLIFSISLFRIVIAFIRAIWDFIPFV